MFNGAKLFAKRNNDSKMLIMMYGKCYNLYNNYLKNIDEKITVVHPMIINMVLRTVHFCKIYVKRNAELK